MPFIPNQPVSFGRDINIYPPLGCVPGRTFYAPVNRGDLTTFILPNICPPIYGSQMIANGDFAAGLGGWEQGNGNGSVNSWEIVSGAAQAIPESKILNQPLPIAAYQTYKLSLDLTLGAGCTLQVVLYRDPYTEGSTDYIVIAEITDTGTQVIQFTADDDYIRIGFILVGDCEDSDIDNIEMYLAEYDCLDICIKDLDGNVIETVTDIDYYGEKVVVTVDWEGLEIPDGCYYICICNDDDTVFAENLFTYGDNGSFEENATGIDSDGGTPGRSTTRAYRGIYSYKVILDGTAPEIILETDDFTLKRNTTYKLSARVWNDLSLEAPPTTISWEDVASTGFADAVIVSQQNMNEFDTGAAWNEIFIEFTTGLDNVGHFEIINDGFGGTEYIDNLLLYEVDSYESCSQGFNLRDSHQGAEMIQYTNDNPAFGFIYPTGFYFYMRIPGGLQHPRYPEELKTFRTTDGIGSVAFGESTKVEVLAVNAVPEYTHDALRIALLHDTLLIGGVAYVKVPGEYRPLWDKGAYIAPVEVEVEKSLQNTKNAKC